ncbi:damage-inducible protein, partial [Ameyamaea chiangmaiensis]|nr:damage-inducible protein [Ameyamaea chiangmaiensis]
MSAATPALEQLRDRIRRLEGRTHDPRRTVLPFGIEAIDRALPGGGLMLGALHDIAGGGADAQHG